MSEIYPLRPYKDKYIELLDDYEFDPGDVVAMGNLIGFLSNYLYSPVEYLFLDEEINQILVNKRLMLEKLTEVLLDSDHDDISMLINLQLAQAFVLSRRLENVKRCIPQHFEMGAGACRNGRC